jgi:hypothetical protein
LILCSVHLGQIHVSRGMSPLRKACISKDVSNLRKHINWVLKHVLVSCQLYCCIWFSLASIWYYSKDLYFFESECGHVHSDGKRKSMVTQYFMMKLRLVVWGYSSSLAKSILSTNTYITNGSRVFSLSAI